MARRSIRSLSVPIVLAAVAVPLSIALLVGWTFLILQNLGFTSGRTVHAWLLVLGAISFMVIMGVLIAFSVFLGREILEVRRQNSFIDSVTHELKSPLASIKLCLETLARENVDVDQREQLRVMMLEDVDRLTAFIDDVLQASRLSYDSSGLLLSDVNLHDLIRQCVENVAARHKIPASDISVDVDPTLAVSTDRAALEIVVKNLIDNAVKYSDQPSTIEVIARIGHGNRPIVEVKDRGIGIPPKHLKKVFHRFYRVPSETVRSRKGTGLGLFVVSALVRNLGGRIEAVSRDPEPGTTMRIVLPAGGTRTSA